jgi:hypothetical protein
LWVATAFTAGHSLTLALSVTNVLTISPRLIEFLIPITIVATGLENLLVRDNATPFATRRYRPVLAGVFGLVHGAGFANYLRSLFVERIALPLFGFNVGIELGQICVLALAFAAFCLVDRLITAARPSRLLSVAPVRLRAVAVSSLVLVVAARWAVERAPWWLGLSPRSRRCWRSAPRRHSRGRIRCTPRSPKSRSTIRARYA